MNEAICQFADSITKAIDNTFKSGKYFILEAHLPKLFPDLFNRIHFRRIRRNEKELNILGNLQSLGLVPSGAVTAEQNDIVLVFLRQFLEEYIHTVCVAIRHDKKEVVSVKRFDCSISVSVFPDVMAGNNRPDSLFAPAILWLVDSTKTRFILKQQVHFFLC